MGTLAMVAIGVFAAYIFWKEYKHTPAPRILAYSLLVFVLAYYIGGLFMAFALNLEDDYLNQVSLTFAALCSVFFCLISAGIAIGAKK